MHRRAVSIVQARIGIVSNNEKLITEPRYFEGQILESLLTNIHSIKPIPYTDDLDAYFVAIDDPNIHPHVRVRKKCFLPLETSLVMKENAQITVTPCSGTWAFSSSISW